MYRSVCAQRDCERGAHACQVPLLVIARLAAIVTCRTLLKCMQRRRVVPLPATVVCTNVRRHLPVVLCCGWCSAGATGISISQSVALISAIDARRNSKDDLAKVALHLVIKSIMEPDALVPMTDGTSPNTVVDTPQPQTPFSPATPDSLPVVKKSNPTDDDAATTALRHDASIALIGTLISRGLLLWEVVQRRLGMDLVRL